MPAGSHSAVWDGRDSKGIAVASGVYFVRLESNDRVSTRKMVLAK
jgi:flagellar hook assembly protein FlgD